MKPILCNYYITYRCNARCSFCAIWKDLRYQTSRDCLFEDLKTNLFQLKKIGVKFIDFTGGEPLLHKDLPQMLEFAKRFNFYTSVTTNCILYAKVAEKIKGRVDLLHFSIDSLDKKENDSLRGCSTFDHVMRSITLAHKLGEKPDLLFTVTASNYQAIEKLSEFAANNKLMLIVNPIFDYKTHQLLSEKILKYIERFKAKPYVYINHAFHQLIRNGGNDCKRPRCRAVSSSIVISPDNGLVVPCFHQARFRIPINSNLVEIIKLPWYRQIKKRQGRFPFCQSCTINCYFDPSFLYRMDRYFFLSLISKAKYGFYKYL